MSLKRYYIKLGNGHSCRCTLRLHPLPFVIRLRSLHQAPGQSISSRKLLHQNRDLLMIKDYGQRFLDFLAYAASFTWVSTMPDWAQPIVWGLLVSLPIVFLLIIAFNRLN